MYTVLDYFTKEIIIKTTDKTQVNTTITEWYKNNPDSCIMIYKDNTCIYP